MFINLCSLFSGSSGNSTYIGTDKTHILVDSGLSGVKVKKALRSVGIEPSDLDAIVITHEHTDHIQSAGVLSREFGIPIYANEKTWTAMDGKIGDIASENIRIFFNDIDFYIKDLNIVPFSIPHDAADPVGFCIHYGNKKISIATDLGYTNNKILDQIRDSNVVILEANHDVDMLSFGPYPKALKNRIMGKKGHLSNEDAGKVAVDLVEGGVTHILLAHLSKQNNLPRLAYETVAHTLALQEIKVGYDMMLDMTHRDRAGNMYHIDI
ncbi:MAG TPA: MBL fold metallo-hydrolase [Clostridiales bacterium]|nr:MBL fold metallo-hydrolase [Clostridiales bacterium]